MHGAVEKTASCDFIYMAAQPKAVRGNRKGGGGGGSGGKGINQFPAPRMRHDVLPHFPALTTSPLTSWQSDSPFPTEPNNMTSLAK